MKGFSNKASASLTRRAKALTQAAVILASVVLPILQVGTASAAQLTSRKVAISDSRFSQTGVSYVFTFTMPSLAAEVEGVKIEACTTANGACTGPTTFSFTPATYGSQSGWDQAVNFAKDATGGTNCTPGAAVLCLQRTTAGNETTNVARVITINNVTNASDVGTNNVENVFLRIQLYTTFTTPNYVTPADSGVVVTGMVNQLSVQATVEETLTFCLYTGANCAAGGSSVDMGVQTTASTDTDANTKIDISGNANGGISVGYYSTQTLTSGSNTITSAGTSGTTNSAGTQEMFGFCVTETGTGTVNPVAPYTTDCNGAAADTYAYDGTGTFDQIAASGAASDLSVLTLKFGTDILNTTESGVYTTTARFIAIPTY